VRDSYRDPLRTYATNVLGTAIYLQACRIARDLQCVLVVTSDKVYEVPMQRPRICQKPTAWGIRPLQWQ